MEDFQQNIKKWVSLDTKIKGMNEEIKTIRDEKHKLSNEIITFVDTNNLKSSTIKISDGKLKFSQNKQTSPISLGFLEKCLNEIIHNEEQVTKIMEYIKDKREVKLIPDIKRFYDN
jgi:hypothetical protein